MKTTNRALFTLIALTAIGFMACGGDDTDPEPTPGTDSQVPKTDNSLPPDNTDSRPPKTDNQTPPADGKCILDASKIEMKITMVFGVTPRFDATGMAGSVGDTQHTPSDCSGGNSACIKLLVYKGETPISSTYYAKPDGSFEMASTDMVKHAQTGDTVTLVVKGAYCTEVRADFVVQ